jgi:RNA polymerase sigma-70 factor (ECF subfamily)
VNIDINSSAWKRREKRLIRRAQKGDRQALGDIYRAYCQLLYSRILMPRLGNPDAAQDALAETFKTVLVKITDFQDQDKGLWPWLARIAANKAYDIYRKDSRQKQALGNYMSLLEPLFQDVDIPVSKSQQRQELEILKKKISAVFEKLNQRYQRALKVRFFENLSRQACAQKMEVKLGTFDVLLLRALRAFRKEWELANER